MPELRVVPTEQRITPTRGIVLTQNAKGRVFDLTDIKRWVRLNQSIYKLEKSDVLLLRPWRGLLPELAEQSRTLSIRLSLRVDCSFSPDDIEPLGSLGLLDLFLSPPKMDWSRIDPWIHAAREANLPIRLQATAPFDEIHDVQAAAQHAADAGISVFNISLADPFIDKPGCGITENSCRTVELMNQLASAVAAHGIETNLLYLPFCFVTEENRVFAANTIQFFLDHQQYHRFSYALAEMLFRRGKNSVGKALEIHLGRSNAWTGGIDARILPWVTANPRVLVKLFLYRKATRVLRLIRGHAKPIEDTVDAYELELRRYREKIDQKAGPKCGQCRLRRMCDHETDVFRKTLPGLEVSPEPGELIPSWMYYAGRQPKCYDAVDAERIDTDARRLALADEANSIVNNLPPTREITSTEYTIEGQWTHQMPGGNRWYSFTNSEKQSTVLTRATPPLTIAFTLGGGLAEYVGINFGRHSKLLFPMEAYSHRIIFHADAEGHYVLLRDGVPIHPVEFEGNLYVPPRVSGLLEPRIHLYNIDGAIVTQTVLLWEHRTRREDDLSRIKYSVLIVSVRYARRLQAVLLSIAHQRDIDLSEIEVIVSYTPGLDATDDLIDSMHMAHPKLRIVRSPFPEGRARAKGFQINESAKLASGEWVVLLDSDTLLPPRLFTAMKDVPSSCYFVASDGRKLLPPEVTARVLLGEIEPWNRWDELLAGPGELRLREAQGVPIGFFQAVRKECLDKIPYQELDHFEGSDWLFGDMVRKKFGSELRLEGYPVLHLDHGGSQWYGTLKHF